MPNRQLDEEAIFQVARGISDPALRATYLDQICAGDLSLRERVEALLEVHEQERRFLESVPQSTVTTEWPAVDEVPGKTIGRYKLLQQIGEGGFGVVYMAEQERPIRRKVALKVIKPGMDTATVVARFEAERQALALMDHPNIARVLDGGATDSGRPYFVMELVKGVSLTEYCDQKQLATEERLQLFIKVCQAVQHAHHKGIIHRDLKPSNILVTLHDGQPVVKVIDFGVAKAINQQLTEKTLFTAYGQMVGTPAYMSPEQAEMSGLDVDTRSDIYSLGVLLYELLTGTTPLESHRLRSAGYAEIQRLIREEDPPKPSTRLSTSGEKLTSISKHRSIAPDRLQRLIQGDLDWIVMKALEKDRSRRYEMPNSLAEDVTRYLNHETILARPVATSYRIRKFVQRNKLLVGAVSAIAVSLLLGTVISTGLALHAYRKQTEAEKQKTISQDALDLLDASEKELRIQNEKQARLLIEYRAELFEKALAAAMSASPNTQQLISKAKVAGVEDWRLKMLEGQRLIFAGQPDQAVEHLQQAVDLAKDSGKPSVAAEAMLAKAYFYSGQLLEAMAQTDSTNALLPIEHYDFIFLAWNNIGTPERALELLVESEKARNPPTAVSLVMRSEIRAFHGYFYGDMDSVTSALQDVSAARLLLGDTKFTLQTELIALIAAINLCREQGQDFRQYELQAKDVADRLLKYKGYAWGRIIRSWYFHEIRDFAAAEAELREICAMNSNPYYQASLAFLIYQKGSDEKSCSEATSIASRLRPPIYQDVVGLILADALSDPKLDQDIDDNQSKEPLFEPISSAGLCRFLASRNPTQSMAEAKKILKQRNPSVPLPPGTRAYLEQSQLEYLADVITEEELVKRANGNREWLCGAYLLIGIRNFAEGDVVTARDKLTIAIKHDLSFFWPYQQSLGLLRRLNDPAWLEKQSARHSSRNH